MTYVQNRKECRERRRGEKAGCRSERVKSGGRKRKGSVGEQSRCQL